MYKFWFDTSFYVNINTQVFEEYKKIPACKKIHYIATANKVIIKKQY